MTPEYQPSPEAEEPMSAPWATVPVSKLPAEAFSLQTYAPDATRCIAGHRFASEADCILPEDEVDAWDYFLCRRCVEDIGGLL